MLVVDLEICASPVVSEYRDQFVVDLVFEHENDEISENIVAVFGADQKADVIEFINFIHAAAPIVEDIQAEPEDVPGYEKFCNYSAPEGMHAWPSDHNGNYFARFEDLYVSYYDANGTQMGVIIKEAE